MSSLMIGARRNMTKRRKEIVIENLTGVSVLLNKVDSSWYVTPVHSNVQQLDNAVVMDVLNQMDRCLYVSTLDDVDPVRVAQQISDFVAGYQ